MLIEGCTWPEAPAAKRAESRGREMTEGRPEAHAQGCRAPALVTGLAVAMQDSRSSPLQEPGTSPPRRTVRYRASVERAVGQVIHARTVADARLLGGSRPELTRAMSPEPGGVSVLSQKMRVLENFCRCRVNIDRSFLRDKSRLKGHKAPVVPGFPGKKFAGTSPRLRIPPPPTPGWPPSGAAVSTPQPASAAGRCAPGAATDALLCCSCRTMVLVNKQVIRVDLPRKYTRRPHGVSVVSVSSDASRVQKRRKVAQSKTQTSCFSPLEHLSMVASMVKPIAGRTSESPSESDGDSAPHAPAAAVIADSSAGMVPATPPEKAPQATGQGARASRGGLATLSSLGSSPPAAGLAPTPVIVAMPSTMPVGTMATPWPQTAAVTMVPYALSIQHTVHAPSKPPATPIPSFALLSPLARQHRWPGVHPVGLVAPVTISF